MTNGQLGSILHWELLSTTMAPSSTAMGASTALASPPAEKIAISTPLKAPFFASLVTHFLPWKVTSLPAWLAISRGTNSFTGKFLLSRVESISVPTTPRAPTTATVYSFAILSTSYELLELSALQICDYTLDDIDTLHQIIFGDHQRR